MDYTKIHAAVNKAIKQGVVDRIISNIEEIRTMIQDERSDEDIKLFFMTLLEEAKKTRKRTPTKATSSTDDADSKSEPIFRMTPEEFVKDIVEQGKFACSWVRKKGKLSDGTDCAGKACGRILSEEECLGDDGKPKSFLEWRCSPLCSRNVKEQQIASMKKIYDSIGITNEVHGTPTKNFNIPSPEGGVELPTRAEEVSGINTSVVSPTAFLNGDKTGLPSPSSSRQKTSPKPPTFKLIKTGDGQDKKKTKFAVSKSPVNGSFICYHHEKKKVCGKFNFDSLPSEFDTLFLQDVVRLDSDDEKIITEMGLEYNYIGKSVEPEPEPVEEDLIVSPPSDTEQDAEEAQSDNDDAMAELLSQLGPDGDSD